MSTSGIPKSMLAWQKHFGSTEPACARFRAENVLTHGNGYQVRVEVPVPTAPEDGLLVKVLAAGVCHSDVHLLKSETKPSYYLDKYTLGHEGCGEVVSVGSSATKFKPGNLVSVLSVPGCGQPTCYECSHGVAQICEGGEHYGIGHDGSYAPYVAIRERAAVRLPPGVSPAVGAVATDAVMTAYQAVVGRAKVKKSDTVLLYGLGGLGFNALQIVLGIGARVIAVDQRQAVLDEAVRYGVREEDVVPVGTKSVSEWVGKKGLAVDSVLDFVGVPDTFKNALESVRPAGTVVLVGLMNPTFTFDALVALRKRLDILGSFGGTYADLEACLDLIAKGVIVPQVETASLADFPQVLADLDAGKVKSRIALIPEGI
ncbi:hypothetical protein A1O3_08907 [Capronia epimyces CBS 606.96]|uniref:Enoyl reductase (ER) domain-containing protein n=1 Tax=Capronia epimyces CBS 606.96 TaxID=1182542 RepID=W9XQ24_9EURO|nr:uncharacterized protein A1O3_08907 [Capronia epimyces CBS 606.96]EXJ79405.1 hypothetical protein A1O3_08907 [Capronia epimyces CBS 606.96]